MGWEEKQFAQKLQEVAISQGFLHRKFLVLSTNGLAFSVQAR
jgi:hypothetical protein